MFGGSHKPTSLGWIMPNENNGETDFGVGGIVQRMSAAQNLVLGDYVFFTNQGLGIAAKSTGVSNYAPTRMGIVVGGTKTYDQVIQDDAQIGVLTVAGFQEHVLVCTFGICKAYGDAAMGITDQFIPSATTAGRIHSGTTAGQIGGLVLETIAAAGVVRVFVRPA